VLQHPQFTLTVLDPTSLLGSDVAAALWQAFPAARRKLFHTSGAEEHLISEVGGEAALVAPLATAGDLDGSDVVVATATPTAALGALVVDWMRANPAAVLIDCTQPGLAPGETDAALSAPPPGRRETRWFHLADPAMWGPGHVLRALAALDLREAHVTALLPASDFGQAGVEELARQATARLSGQPIRRPEALPAVLAFDAAPAAEARREALRGQLAALFPGIAVHLAALQIGVFFGHTAHLAVRCGASVDEARVASLLRHAQGVRTARRNERPQPTTAVDGEEIVCSDLRCEGEWAMLWLVADGVRAGGAQVVVDIVSAVRAS